MATAIIDVAALGFLGLGPPDPRHAGVGDDALRREPLLRQRRRTSRSLPGIAIVLVRPRLQPDRRRAARGARPEAPRPMKPAREPLLSVEDLHVEFWTSRGTVYAVNGITFDIAPGETLGHRGRVGLREERHLPRSARHPLRAPAGSRPGRRCSRAATSSTLPDDALRKIRGRDIAMIFQDPMTSLNPVLTVGRQIREALETHFDLDKKAGERARRRSCSTASASRARRCGSRTIRTSSRAACASAR